MALKKSSFSTIRLLVRAGLSFAVLWSTSEARELLRGGPSPSGPTATTPGAVDGTAPATTAPAVPSASVRLTRTKDALNAVGQMQLAARNLASGLVRDSAGNLISAPKKLRSDLAEVLANSWKTTNGLNLSSSVGATVPDLPAGTPTVTITQTQQQAVLNWDSFNIGQTTTLNFDQSAGGANVGQWIAFNKIGVTGSPSQILGKISTIGGPADAKGNFPVGGQVYVINPNGIIFGGSSQVNAHALVASSLPINDSLVQRGLLNNPDAQFLFSGLAQTGGSNGPTGAFTPTVRDENGIAAGGSSATSVRKVSDPASVSLTYAAGNVSQALVVNTDYTTAQDTAGGKVTAALTAAGQSKVAGGKVDFSYTPAASEYGDVVVQPGALLTAPTNADHVGGRIALIGPNVTNAGTISTDDGQTILAAGLQVGFVSHTSSDPTLRGLDVYVGAVTADPLLKNAATNAGTDFYDTVAGGFLKNDAATYVNTANGTSANNPNKLDVLGLISAARGDVYVTGQAVNQSGVISSSTSVAYNGRVDLVAGFNAVANEKFDPTGSDHFTLSPFVYQSNAGNSPTGAAVPNSGPVSLGQDSVISIMPETGSSDRVVGDLALPSQVNLQGESVHFAPNSTLLAPGAAVPFNPAFGADGAALDAGVTIRAGNWFNPDSNSYKFVQSQDSQQIYFDQGAAVDVAGLNNTDASGLTNFSASVTENIVPVELRGTELANSPLQRDGPLRGQTIKVDVRQHGPWDPKLNGGLGGYTWVGTPLADTSGWIGLTTHSVGELMINGGSVSLKAGGAMVLNPGATIDVSGGAITYAGGVTQTTKVVANGHVYDISQATPERIYDSIYTGTTSTTDSKWGVTTTISNPLALSTYENGYTQGGSGGSLSIAAPVMALDGTLKGNTIASAGQRTLSPLYKPGSLPVTANPTTIGEPGWLLNALNLPVPSQLSIAVKRQYLSDAGTVPDYVDYSPTPANIVIGSSSSPIPLTVTDNFQSTGVYDFPGKRNYELDLSTSLVANNGAGAGFGILSVNNSDDNVGESPLYSANSTITRGGDITIAHGTVLELPVAGSLSLSAANITVEGNTTAREITGIKVPGGSVKLTAFDISPSRAAVISTVAGNGTVPPETVPQYDSTRGKITLGAGATLDASGGVQDERLGSLTGNIASLITTGGAVTLNASSVLLNATSVVDVSGGGAFSASGKLTYADAGSITISSGKAVGSGFGAVLGGGLQMDGTTLQGYAGVGKNGGRLSVQAPSISLVASLPDGNGADVTTDVQTGALSFTPEFFDAGGFSAFSLTALGISVALNKDGAMTGALPALVIGSPDALATGARYPCRARPPSCNRKCRAGCRPPAVPYIRRMIGCSDRCNSPSTRSVCCPTPQKIPWATIPPWCCATTPPFSTTPNSSVAFQGSTVDLLGSVTAHGGSITVADNKDPILGDLPTIHLGPVSVLDVSGATVSTIDLTGIHATAVLDGGDITVDGNIVAEGAGMVKDENGKPLLDQNGIARHGPGALLNVSGSSDTVFLAPGDPADGLSNQPRAALTPVVESSNGGTLTLRAQRELFSAATIRGNLGTSPSGGATTAQGGNLVVESNMIANSGAVLTRSDPILNLASATPAFVYTKLGQQVTDGIKVLGDARGFDLIWFGADGLSNSGFGGLSFLTGNGALQVKGNVALSADRQVSLANGGVLLFTPVTTGSVTKPSSLSLTAPYVVLGQPFQPPQPGAAPALPGTPITGSGVLAVQASSLIDVGNLVLQGAGTADLDATYDPQTKTDKTTGAIRGDGTLAVAGDIKLKAGQIYPPTAVTFDVIADDYLKKTDDLTLTPGSVTIESAVSPSNPNPAPTALPLSAGGFLNIYASTITQGGTLRAPLGTIQLGVGSDNLLSGTGLPPTTSLILKPGSVTSVSALDPVTGLRVTIPYGINVNGDTWIDPAGSDITRVGPAAQSVTLTAADIRIQAAASGQAAAKIDLSGGGDLSAYQFVPGTGGKTDILLGTTAGSFAIVPGYTDVYAPVAPFNSSTDAAKANLGKDTGYVVENDKLSYKIGDRIHIDLQDGKGPQDYTLLPARYALLSGAYLVTPQTSATTAGAAPSIKKPDGSVVVSAFRFNGLNAAAQTQSQYDSFEVAAQAVVLKRAEYKRYSANTFFTDLAKSNDQTAPRLPVDAGRLGLAVGTSLDFQGVVQAQAATGGRGGMVDISSDSDILIGSHTVLSSLEPGEASGKILLDAAELSGFGAESLLIGGKRTTGAQGTAVTVTSNSVTVDNAGEALTGSDVILVANQNLTLGKNAEIGRTGETQVTADPLKVVGSVKLTKAGEILSVERGGTAISVPDGTGDTLLTATSAGTITNPDGTTEKFEATTDGTDNAFQVSAHSTITLDAAGAIALASSTEPTRATD